MKLFSCFRRSYPIPCKTKEFGSLKVSLLHTKSWLALPNTDKYICIGKDVSNSDVNSCGLHKHYYGVLSNCEGILCTNFLGHIILPKCWWLLVLPQKKLDPRYLLLDSCRGETCKKPHAGRPLGLLESESKLDKSTIEGARVIQMGCKRLKLWVATEVRPSKTEVDNKMNK